MKVTKSLRDSLVQSALEEFTRATNFYNTAKAAYDEARNTYDWARGLVIGGDLTYNQRQQVNKPLVNTTVPYSLKIVSARYFIPSKSGTTQGHYIRRYTDYSVDCTCPGYVNRGYCWASTKVLNNGVDIYTYLWNKSLAIFETNRERAVQTTQY